MKKKCFTIFLSVLFLLSITPLNIAFGSNHSSVRQVNGISVASSITDEQVENLPFSIVDRLQKNDGVLVSVTTENFDLDPWTGKFTRSTMPESDFEIIVTVQELSVNEKIEDGYEIDDSVLPTDDAFEFTATGLWKINPTYEFTDCIGITWSDDFTLYYDEGYTVSSNGNIAHGTMQLNDVAPEEGFAYDVDLELFDNQSEIVIIGRVHKPNSSGTANICASYGHVIYVADAVSVSYSSGKEIGFSVGIMADIQTASPDYDSFRY